MAFVHHERGDDVSAGKRSLQAVQAGRAADNDARQHHLANTGRCLAQIERDVADAERFLHEAHSLGEGASGRALIEMVFGTGLVRAFKGLDDEAVPRLQRAADLAAQEPDHWVHSQALTRIARLALEGGRPAEALTRCVALEPLVAKLPEGSEEPFVLALRALARIELGEAGADSAAEQALEQLRRVDSKAHVAYVLNALADHDARAGRTDDARRRAHEALRAAETVAQKSEAAVARSHLAMLALAGADHDAARAWLDACRPDLGIPLALSARAQAAVARVAERLGDGPAAQK
jgi:hypothetical protein